MEIFESKKAGVLMVYMSRDEALKTIISLTTQIRENSPNVGRYEQHVRDGRDFSIAVTPEHREGEQYERRTAQTEARRVRRQDHHGG